MAEIRLTGRASDFSGVVLKAAARGDLEAVKELVARNRNWVAEVGPHGRTMLWEAAYRGRLAVVEYLLDCDADPHQPGGYYTPMLAEVAPLTAALLMHHKPVAGLLAQRGGMVDLHDACYLGETVRVQEELSRNRSLVSLPKPRTSDLSAATPLFYAVAGEQAEVCRLLLSVGPESQAHDGLLLRWAAWRGNAEILEQLLARGADPRASGIDWSTPELDPLARRFGHLPDVNAPNWLGFPPLVDACRGNHNQTDDPQRVQRLLDAGADVNRLDARGKSALHRAAQAGFVRIPAVLIPLGAELDAVDPEGETPLFEAIRGGHVATVRFLLDVGANTAIVNRKGRTALQVAESLRIANRDEIATLLTKAVESVTNE